MMLAILSSISISAHAEDSFKGWTFSGFLDLYYQSDFGKPPTGNSLTLRQFDTFNNGFQLATAQLNAVRKPTADNPLGFTFNFAGGRNADVLAAGEPAGSDSAFKYIQQAYVTYARENAGFTVDFGKFLTWVGYEGIISADNDNYSRSFLFYTSQPVYHVGLRGSTSAGPATVSAFLVNGWNEAEDSNAGKSYGLSVGAPVGKASVTANYYGGTEGSSRMNGFFAVEGPAQTSVHLGDLVVVYPINDKFKVALNADYGTGSEIDNSGVDGKFYGVALYAKYQFDSKLAGAVRYETVSDPDGLRTGTDSLLNSLTGTLDFAFAENALLRFELRHDTSNRSLFRGDNGGFEDKRTTFTIATSFKF